MPQTMAFVSLEKSGRCEVAFRTRSLLIAVAPSIAPSAVVESSLFYKKKQFYQHKVSSRSKVVSASKALKKPTDDNCRSKLAELVRLLRCSS